MEARIQGLVEAYPLQVVVPIRLVGVIRALREMDQRYDMPSLMDRCCWYRSRRCTDKGLSNEKNGAVMEDLRVFLLDLAYHKGPTSLYLITIVDGWTTCSGSQRCSTGSRLAKEHMGRYITWHSVMVG
ncbi:hypothetical protein R1flu_004646 [Riccia fluitans]|uniref:Uncharacterized protein n=1 Tax=Riccia fluitans TaxID=41844 RepID=A0ABD1YQW8_9MARC